LFARWTPGWKQPSDRAVEPLSFSLRGCRHQNDGHCRHSMWASAFLERSGFHQTCEPALFVGLCCSLPSAPGSVPRQSGAAIPHRIPGVPGWPWRLAGQQLTDRRPVASTCSLDLAGTGTGRAPTRGGTTVRPGCDDPDRISRDLPDRIPAARGAGRDAGRLIDHGGDTPRSPVRPGL
jgi:hypothetical protein